MDSNKNSIWKSFWVKLIAVLSFISIIATITGFTLKDWISSCNTGTPPDEIIIEESTEEENEDAPTEEENEDIPTEEEIKQEIQQKTGKAWIEDVPILSYDCPMTIWGDSIFSYDLESLAIANTGNEYEHSLVMNTNLYYGKDNAKGNHHEIMFYTDGQYDTFSFIFALDQETKDNNGEVTVTISADDTTVWSGKTYKNVIPQKVSLDINKAVTVSILCTVTKDGNHKCLNSIFGNAYFSTDET